MKYPNEIRKQLDAMISKEVRVTFKDVNYASGNKTKTLKERTQQTWYTIQGVGSRRCSYEAALRLAYNALNKL